MLAKVACLSVHTLALILSIRPPVSSTTKEKSDKVKDEGLFSTIMIRMMPRFGQIAAILGTSVYILLMAKGVIPNELRPWQALTSLCGVLGYGLRLWSFRTLDRFFTFSLTIRPGHRLVQDGPYRLLLHPSYTGLMMTGITYLFLLASDGYWSYVIKPLLPIPVPGALVTLGGLLLSIGLTVFRVQGEEAMLEQHFGKEFRDYAAARWRFLPYII